MRRPAVEAATPSTPATVEQSEGVLPDAAAPAEAPAPVAPLAPVAPAPKPIGAGSRHQTGPGVASIVSSPAARESRVAAKLRRPRRPAKRRWRPSRPRRFPRAIVSRRVRLSRRLPFSKNWSSRRSRSSVCRWKRRSRANDARLEDEVVARVTRDVKVGDRVAIPAGARAQGEVTLVERGGRVRERARLGVRFTSIVLADGTRLPIHTEAVLREGDSPGRESAAKIGGGAIGGAIIGGILGGAKGAAIGSTVGAGAGTGGGHGRRAQPRDAAVRARRSPSVWKSPSRSPSNADSLVGLSDSV